MLPSQTGTSEHTPKTHCFFVAGGSFLVSIWSSYGFCHLPLGVSLSCEKCGLTADGEHTGLLPAGQGDPDRVASGGREDGARGPYADRSRSGGWCELAQRWSRGCRRCAIRRTD